MPAPVAVAPAPVAAPAAVKPTAPVVTTPAVEEAMFEVTVAGKPQKLTRKQIEKFAGKGAFADQTVQQAKAALKAAADQRRELEEEEAGWKDESKWEELMRKRGVDPDKFARSKLDRRLAEAEMSPEQKRIQELEASNAETAKRLKAADDEKELARHEATTKHVQARVDSVLGDAWERGGFQRGDVEAFGLAYEVLREWNEIGLVPKRVDEFSPEFADRVVDAVKEKVEAADKRREGAVLKGLKGAALVQRLGKSVVDEILRFKIEELRGGGLKKTNGAAPPIRQGEQHKTLSTQEAWKAIRGGA